MPTTRRGQLTLIIILGMIAVLTVAFIIYLASKGAIGFSKNSDTFDVSVRKVHDWYSFCSSNAFKDTLSTIGYNGGYAIPPTELQVDETGFVYWFYGQKRTRTVDEVARDIGNALVERLETECREMDGSRWLRVFELEILGPPTVDVSINEEDVTAVVSYNYIVRQGPIQQKSTPFDFTEKVRLRKILEYGNNITTAFAETGGLLVDGDAPLEVNYHPYKTSILVNVSGDVGTVTGTGNYQFWLALRVPPQSMNVQ